MRTVDLIEKKRDGHEMTAEEIQYLIREYNAGRIPDYQMSAWAMAVFFRGMSIRETADLTLAMANSGDVMDLGPIHGIKVDKHSTGGVGDKTTLVLGPLVAAAGVPVAKMSGRGLGHTGGTIDKLESIKGFAVERTRQDFILQVNECGLAVISQSGNITPADKKLYALRDVTATVNSIPLIASSVMSKKIASGADAIVLDVKTGSGAFMKSLDEAVKLAQAMVNIGTQVGRETIALISEMDQPLGFAVGNALEVREAIETLQGGGPEDLKLLCLALGAYMLVLGKKASGLQEAKDRLQELLVNGLALEKFSEFISAQGGDASVAQNPDLLPSAGRQIEISAGASGYVTAINAEDIGLAAMMLGAGRETKDSAIDLSVGIVLRKKLGDPVVMGEALAVLHTNSIRNEAGNHDKKHSEIERKVQKAFQISPHPAQFRPLIHAVVTKDGIKEWKDF
ncbi:pyrimidine-nucleoside phosphorylase [Ferviditalea candida]|uniref:Pyrimidine-nucleoside phosphorylase n=1 Tax=Ferviditalea candida TaxID=3108399 RepID=A0ABU5ZJS3_9BACL|nr:pyrimidine-nucleoside phosphorylase [Paenibacillaceae bacterium T2]